MTDFNLEKLPSLNEARLQPVALSKSLDSTPDIAKVEKCLRKDFEEFVRLRSTPAPYAGRLGGNQEFVVDPSDPSAQSLLEKTPDAAPWMSLRATLSFAGFKEPTLWKAALMEGMATMMLCYITVMLSLSPALNVAAPLPVTGPAGVFGTANFIGPVMGAITNVIVLSLFIFSFGAVSGGHMNPLITIATFFCRMTTLPRMVLYVAFQIAGATLAGLLVRGSVNNIHWKAGGCFVDPNLVNTRQMFTLEFASCLTMLFLAFGVGLDPRQASTFGPALAPILVGFVLGVTCLATAFAVPGFGGAGMNPGRCFAVWIGSGKSLGVTGANAELGYAGPNGGRLWIYWVAAIAAGMCHAAFYQLVPPWSTGGQGKLEVNQPKPQKDAIGQPKV
ncbi:hypothetical protein H2198_003988 [Neophaeococcomyces mojaviensis]|uniref:Uncharacterized protein n=1 Tax=Neophaeococcomyces mojaviensis TaxID=3383035 RepID=A0ACC3AAQ5_9EURO|nr:hypothetical protein H2198_003988 [Knufia sp. JES_112]